MTEHKYFLTALSRTDAVLADTIPFQLTLIPQGQTETSRVGDVLTGTSLEVAFHSYPPLDFSTTRLFMFRFIGFVWKQDTVPTIADLLDPNYTGAANILKPLQPFNHNQKINRKILWDKRYIIYADGDATTSDWHVIAGNGTRTNKFVLNLTKLKRNLNKIWFNPGSSTIARNHIYATFLTTDIGATNGPNFYMQAKYTFTDN